MGFWLVGWETMAECTQGIVTEGEAEMRRRGERKKGKEEKERSIRK